MTGIYIDCKFTVIASPYLINFKNEPSQYVHKNYIINFFPAIFRRLF